MLAAIAGLLNRSECREHLLIGMDSPDKDTRRIAFRMAIEAGDVAGLCRRAMESPDSLVRLKAAQVVAERLSDEEFAELFELMRWDTSMPVRREALNKCMTAMPNRAYDELRSGLLDRSKPLREFCHFYLKRQGMSDFVAYYRLAVIENRPVMELAAAIAGIGETGTRPDADFLAEYCSDPRCRIRRAAVGAYGRLAGADGVPMLIEKLNDGFVSVSGVAQKILMASVSVASIEDIWQSFLRESRQRVARQILHLMLSYSRWQALPYLVKACGRDFEIGWTCGASVLEPFLEASNWTSVFTQPTGKQLQEIDAAISDVKWTGGLDLLPRLNEALQPFRRRLAPPSTTPESP